jgi:hypothetical protein
MRRSLLSLLALAAAAAAGCAHAPRGDVRAHGAPADIAPDAPPGGGARPEKVLVTGSRIPRRVDPRTGLPELASPLTVLGRRQLVQAGAAEDLGAALYRLEPAVAP